MICIVSSFELELTRVRLHCQQPTLEVLFLAVLGVFKGDVSLQIKTAKRGGNRALISKRSNKRRYRTGVKRPSCVAHGHGGQPDLASAPDDLKTIAVDDRKSSKRA